MMGKRAARETATVLLYFAGETKVLNACLFLLLFAVYRLSVIAGEKYFY